EIAINTTPGISRAAAVISAVADLGHQLRVSGTELVIFPDESDGVLKLAWKIRGRGNGLWVYYINAADGTVLLKYDDLRRAFCPTYGTSTAKVYAVSPLPGYNIDSLNVTEDLWKPLVTVPLRDQYFWAGDYSSTTVTNAAGDYCTNQPGKVFSSLKGPYFAVTNFRGPSAHYDNGNGVWRVYSSTITPNSVPGDYPVTVVSLLNAGESFAKVMPHFLSFNAGTLDMFGTVDDADMVYVKNGATGARLGAYIGTRSAAFYGAAVESPSYTVTLQSDGMGAAGNFTVDISSYLVLQNASVSSNPGSVLWSTATTGVYLDRSLGDTTATAEVNAFYHLNAIHRFYDALNVNTSGGVGADLSSQVPVMVHASGNPDNLTGCSQYCIGMLNAYYDLEKDMILIGDGQMDNYNKYRSFAMDGTIVRHEYTHLVINRIYPIINFGEFGAISEAMADYFSLASFWKEGYNGNVYTNQSTLGNFVGAGEGAARDLSATGPTSLRKMPNDWYGEVHEDSLILSQALYELRSSTPTTSTDLGTFGAGTFSGLSRADVLIFSALFYFPDNFNNFYDAMIDACSQFDAKWGGQCDALVRNKITAAFSHHNIGTAAGQDSYETGSNSALCSNNNGPECAADISSLSSLSATVSPLGDVDYYSLPLSAGNFSVKLDLPLASDGIYYAYSMFLFDSNRNYVTEADPVIYGTGSDACPATGQCYTLNPSVILNYTVPPGGARYYLVVSASPNVYNGNSEANSPSPYRLTISHLPQGSAAASLFSAVYDNDQISFDVPFSQFAMAGSPSSSTLTGAETVFQYAQLRDYNYEPLAQTRTDLSGTYLKPSGSIGYHGGSDPQGRPLISGKVQVQPGFAARYPGVGTVYLEVFGRNHLGQILSLGVSNSINLSANGADVTAYNNIITSAGGAAIIKYAVTQSGSLSIKVYTQAGALVRTVYDGPVPAGKGTVGWDGTNSNGGRAASGIYFVKTKGPGLDKTVKVAVVR
ncbi:MAG: hypothetical protein M0011_05925, partial [Elusimicrobia bacterium]|nr:hypothetical protein [Elusimicrobiota bacterium]